MNYSQYITETLKELTNIPSPSGYTGRVTEYLINTLSKMGYKPAKTVKGNVECILNEGAEPLVLAAHVDTLGAMVRSIKDNGRLKPTTIGGHQWSTADGENYFIFTRDGRKYTGVILNKEPSAHVASEKVDTKEENMEILLDENISSKEEALKLGINNGDYIALDPRTVITESGYIKSRFLDDKLSAAILITLARYLKEEKVSLNRKLTIIFTVNEEVGFGGSFIPGDTKDMISVDMGCVGDDLSCKETMVSICAKDSGGPYNYELTTELINIARANNLDYAIDIYPHYDSDVETTIRAGYDIRHALIGPGVYASHNYERSHVNGALNTFKLLVSYIS